MREFILFSTTFTVCTWYQSPTRKSPLLSMVDNSSSSSSSSSANFTTNPISSTSSLPTLVHLHQLITIKLNRDNYLLWKAQVVPYSLGQHLFGTWMALSHVLLNLFQTPIPLLMVPPPLPILPFSYGGNKTKSY